MRYDAYPDTYEKLRNLASESGMTLDAFSQKHFGFTRQTLLNKFSGKTPLFFDEAKKAAAILEISLNDFS